MRERSKQILLLATFLPWCWLMMMVVHECGHVVACWLVGGEIDRVILHPLTISQTILNENPNPTVIAWGGPIFGCVFPIILWLALMKVQLLSALARFFAGFCLVANGIYLAAGALYKVGDAGDLLHHGSALWVLLTVSLFLSAWGLNLWNGLGPSFGFGKNRRPIPTQQILISTVLLMLTIVLELLFSARY